MAYLGIRTGLVDPNWVEGEWLKVYINTMDGKSIKLEPLQDEFSVGMLKTMLWTKKKPSEPSKPHLGRRCAGR
jgi:hypothetical protein